MAYYIDRDEKVRTFVMCLPMSRGLETITLDGGTVVQDANPARMFAVHPSENSLLRFDGAHWLYRGEPLPPCGGTYHARAL